MLIGIETGRSLNLVTGYKKIFSHSTLVQFLVSCSLLSLTKKQSNIATDEKCCLSNSIIGCVLFFF
jgi:hypothetical protein